MRSWSDQEKRWLVRNCCRPDADFVFPAKVEYGKSRTFQHAWIKDYGWLSYSMAKQGGYCVACVLFNKRPAMLGELVNSPLTNLTRAKQTLREHSEQAHHRAALEDMAVFLGQQERGAVTVEQQLQSHAAQTVQRNRATLLSILKCVVFCGRQNIALRGHRDESPVFQDGCFQVTGNPGNFISLLQFRINAGDSQLSSHFASTVRTMQYRSATVQNELIAACGQWIQEKIVAEVKAAKFFSVCADEAADISNKEQLPLVLRFVDESGTIREEFIEFVLCDSGTTGEAIATKLVSSLQKLGLDLDNLRGQGYDGAGNMAGRAQGVAARIQQNYPRTLCSLWRTCPQPLCRWCM